MTTGSTIEESPHGAEPPGLEPSRGGWLGRAGMAVIAATAGVVALRQDVAAAGGCPTGHPAGGCCCLTFAPGGCPGSGPSHGCDAYHTKRTWYCCNGTSTIACSECVKADNCFGDSYDPNEFQCSEYWVVASGVC